jgi:hypothetical protein
MLEINSTDIFLTHIYYILLPHHYTTLFLTLNAIDELKCSV